jgi:hypothetical protein
MAYTPRSRERGKVMKEIIEQEIAKDLNYLLIEGDNEQDRSYFDGKIAGMRWVLTQLEKEKE